LDTNLCIQSRCRVIASIIIDYCRTTTTYHCHNTNNMADSIISTLQNYKVDPLPAALIAVGGLVVLNFTLGVSFWSDLMY
jgi:hypothetical protein